jgi:hypothetical protein
MTHGLLLSLALIAVLCVPSSGRYCLVAPPITPNDEFFTLGRVPEVPPDWTLVIINKDWYVDFSDFSLLADQWLTSGGGLAADVVPDGGDGKVGLRDLTLIADEWLRCLVPAATDPLPADGQEDVGVAAELVWLSHEGSTHYDVYFGTDACPVAAATYGSQEYLGSVVDNVFNLGRILEYNTVYYWRIDQIGPRCTTVGQIWSFRTRSEDRGPKTEDRKRTTEDGLLISDFGLRSSDKIVKRDVISSRNL